VRYHFAAVRSTAGFAAGHRNRA